MVPAVAVIGAAGALIAGQTAVASPSPGTASKAGVSFSSRASERLVGQLRGRPFQPTSSLRVAAPTIPFYSDTFRVGKTTYRYRSVGTDPKTSAATITQIVSLPPPPKMPSGS